MNNGHASNCTCRRCRNQASVSQQLGRSTSKASTSQEEIRWFSEGGADSPKVAASDYKAASRLTSMGLGRSVSTASTARTPLAGTPQAMMGRAVSTTSQSLARSSFGSVDQSEALQGDREFWLACVSAYTPKQMQGQKFFRTAQRQWRNGGNTPSWEASVMRYQSDGAMTRDAWRELAAYLPSAFTGFDKQSMRGMMERYRVDHREELFQMASQREWLSHVIKTKSRRAFEPMRSVFDSGKQLASVRHDEVSQWVLEATGKSEQLVHQGAFLAVSTPLLELVALRGFAMDGYKSGCLAESYALLEEVAARIVATVGLPANPGLPMSASESWSKKFAAPLPSVMEAPDAWHLLAITLDNMGRNVREMYSGITWDGQRGEMASMMQRAVELHSCALNTAAHVLQAGSATKLHPPLVVIAANARSNLAVAQRRLAQSQMRFLVASDPETMCASVEILEALEAQETLKAAPEVQEQAVEATPSCWACSWFGLGGTGVPDAAQPPEPTEKAEVMKEVACNPELALRLEVARNLRANEEHCKEALRFRIALQDFTGVSGSIIGICETKVFQSFLGNAVDQIGVMRLLQQAASIREEMGDNWGVADTRRRIARMFLSQRYNHAAGFYYMYPPQEFSDTRRYLGPVEFYMAVQEAPPGPPQLLCDMAVDMAEEIVCADDEFTAAVLTKLPKHQFCGQASDWSQQQVVAYLAGLADEIRELKGVGGSVGHHRSDVDALRVVHPEVYSWLRNRRLMQGTSLNVNQWIRQEGGTFVEALANALYAEVPREEELQVIMELQSSARPTCAIHCLDDIV